MNGASRDAADWARWLPPAALREALPVAAVDACLREWSSEWLAAGSVHATGWDDAAKSPAALHWVVPGQAWLALPAEGEARLGQLMLGKPPLDTVLTTADRERVDAVVSGAIADLRQKLSVALGLADDWARAAVDGDHWTACCPFSTGTGAVIGTLSLHRDWLVNRRRGGRQPTGGGMLDPHATAIRLQAIRLGARVGNAALTLSDLTGLRCGDVVLLDRSVADPLDLTIDGMSVPVPCQLSDAGESFQLHLS